MGKEEKPAFKRPAFFRRRDVLLLAALLLLAGVWLALHYARAGGALAVVSMARPSGNTDVLELRLGRDETIRLTEGLPFPVTLEVKGGGVRFIHSQCPDHRCEHFGWLRREGEWALCAPAGVMVRVVEDGP